MGNSRRDQPHENPTGVRLRYDTDNWPYIPAKHFTSLKGKPPREVRLLVLHDMEYTEKLTAAEDVARYFAITDTKASAHICVDADSIVQCVKDRDVAWAAPGANNDGIQIELAGYARQTAKEWADPYSVMVLERAAKAVAQYCRKYNIPVRRLSNGELQAGERGIVSHSQVSEVYHKSDHTDPGPGFPWLWFLSRTSAYREQIRKVHG
jgi:N-acetyl-anhydromuramyl-L-alanine amidase AmpD